MKLFPDISVNKAIVMNKNQLDKPKISKYKFSLIPFILFNALVCVAVFHTTIFVLSSVYSSISNVIPPENMLNIITWYSILASFVFVMSLKKRMDELVSEREQQ